MFIDPPPDFFSHSFNVTKYFQAIETKSREANFRQKHIPPKIVSDLLRIMMGDTIHFNDELQGKAGKISNVVQDRPFPAKLIATHLTVAKDVFPHAGCGPGHRMPVFVGVVAEALVVVMEGFAWHFI